MPKQYIPIDQFGNPIQAPTTTAYQTQQPQQTAQQTNPDVGVTAQFSPEKYAADSALKQMYEAARRGMRPTQGDYEDARKAAYTEGMGMLRSLQQQQAQTAREKEMEVFRQFGPRNMTAEEIKDASGLLNAHNQIMTLWHQNQDIGQNHPYRSVQPVGEGIGKIASMTDPNIRLYEATRGGSIISLGRGLLQDTGQVAGKEQAQDLIRQLMPGPGDSVEMSARKSADMLQMTLNGIQSKIQALPSNVNSDPLKIAYRQAYNDYATLVNQYGSNAQKNYPAASPGDLFGQDSPVAKAAPTIAPAVSVGTSQKTSDALNAALSGQQPPSAANQSGTKQYQPISSEGTPGGPGVTSYPEVAPSYVPSEETSAAVQALIAAPGQAKTLATEAYQALKPREGGPDKDVTLPPRLPFEYLGSQ